MNAELETTWRDLVAEAAEQRRRADLFPELTEALGLLLADVEQYEAWQRPCLAVDTARALLVRCRKPQP